MRKNGLERPLSGMQVATWILLPVLLAQFLIFCRPLFQMEAAIPLTACICALAVGAACFGVVTSKINPMDDRLYLHLYGKPSPTYNRRDSEAKEQEQTKHCWICGTNVHVLSMHCKFCDKCVGTFDHHCMWLNTCVGSANYAFFFRTVYFTLLFCLVHMGALCAIVTLFFLDLWEVHANAKNWFSLNKPYAVIAVNIAFLPITFGSVFMLTQLWIFHVGLQFEGITTYQYIIRYNARKRDHSKVELEIMNKRTLAIQNAISGGKSFALCRLRAGKICPPCDPIRSAVVREHEGQLREMFRTNSQPSYQQNEEEDDDDDDDNDDSRILDEEGGRRCRSGSGSYQDHSRARGDILSYPKCKESRVDQTPRLEHSDSPFDERDEGENQANTSPPAMNSQTVNVPDRFDQPTVWNGQDNQSFTSGTSGKNHTVTIHSFDGTVVSPCLDSNDNEFTIRNDDGSIHNSVSNQSHQKQSLVASDVESIEVEIKDGLSAASTVMEHKALDGIRIDHIPPALPDSKVVGQTKLAGKVPVHTRMSGSRTTFSKLRSKDQQRSALPGEIVVRGYDSGAPPREIRVVSPSKSRIAQHN